MRCGNKQTAIISLYLDIKTTSTPKFFKQALEYCKQRGYSILIGSDTNSLCKLWGNVDNTRGKQLEQLIEDEQLLVHNIGRIPTFESQNGKSMIDIVVQSKNKHK